MSVYSGKPFTRETWVRCLVDLKTAFPKLPNGYWQLILNRMGDKGFTDRKLIDATKHLIDTCPYPEPAPANFLDFDKKIEMISEFEMNEKATREGKDIRRFYDNIEIEGRSYWTPKGNAGRYNLPLWKTRPVDNTPRAAKHVERWKNRNTEPGKWKGVFDDILKRNAKNDHD